MDTNQRLTLTKVKNTKVDEAYASGDEDRLRMELYSLAQKITRDGYQLAGSKTKENPKQPIDVTKDDIAATEFVMEHIWKKLPKYRVLEGSRFSSWAYRVLSLRFRDWLRQQKAWHKKLALVYGEDTEGEDGGEGESAADHLGRLCASGFQRSSSGVRLSTQGAIPAPQKFGRRQFQRLRANKALEMWSRGASKIEIAAHLSMGKRKAVKPSSVAPSLSRWRKNKIYLDNISIY